MRKVIPFLRKYEFPIQLFIAKTIVCARLSTWWGTNRAKMLLSALGCCYGRGLAVDGTLWLWVEKRGSIHLGDGVRINSRRASNWVGMTNPAIFECRGNGCITIGNHSGLSGAVLSSRSCITLGEHVNIGGNVRIYDHDYHSLNHKERRSREADQTNIKSRPIVIGKDVFIGVNSIILKGVTIGDRAIIGAGSVVRCNVPPDELWAGNPAVKIR